MIGIVIFLALLFGGIAVWAGIRLIKINRNRASRPRVMASSPTGPWGARIMRERGRATMHPGNLPH